MSYTYTTLKQAILDYTENDETTFVSNLPVFIKNTEERILKNVQYICEEKDRFYPASQPLYIELEDYLTTHIT